LKPINTNSKLGQININSNTNSELGQINTNGDTNSELGQINTNSDTNSDSEFTFVDQKLINSD
jgi:hypothetical protein